jgi:hypothetical protein
MVADRGSARRTVPLLRISMQWLDGQGESLSFRTANRRGFPGAMGGETAIGNIYRQSAEIFYTHVPTI